MKARKILGGEFIGTTVGLDCMHGERRVTTKIEQYRHADGGISLQPVSGRNLSKIGEPTFISAESFSNRPDDPYNSAVEAIWMMEQCGLHVCGVSDDVSTDNDFCY